MNVSLKPGKYVLAVSGGVDSIVLLDILTKLPGVELVIAHYDHGIRPDSSIERQLVSDLAQAHGVPYETEEGRLGSRVSEAAARYARYDFLERTRTLHGAQAIITAHHQDDLLETMVLNMLRGTGRRGLSSLRSDGAILRPLLRVPKIELLRYAKEKGLSWREDSTNADTKYLRNYIRQNIMPRFASTDRQELIALHQKFYRLNQELEDEITDWLDTHAQDVSLKRHDFIMLPHNVAREIMAGWLLRHTDVQLSKKLLERLVIAAKTGPINSKFDVNQQWWLRVGDVFLALEPRER
jgi:tRNA(Ile)-lysidine synthetase-like protein